MANLPELRSKEQIIGNLIDGFLARVKDVDDLNRGSVISQFFHAVGQSNFKAAADIISMIDALSIDRAEGEALQRLAADANVPISSGTFSSGRVDIRDTSFEKISSNIYSGQPAPVAGSITLFVVDASKFNTNGGELYIGRGTPNVEGPLNYTSVQAEGGGSYWSVTLSTNSPTTKFHNIGEEIVVAQGGARRINSGTIVKTPTGSGVSSVSFKTVSPATIPDGEVLVTDVPVSATVIGPQGNVPRGSIREAEGLPFDAAVFNNDAFVTGTSPDDEDTIRTNIKAAEQAKSKGTEQAIKAAAIGVVSNDDLKKVQSSSVLRSADNSTELIFDDGTGYEPIFSGVGIEQVIDDALGGETELQLRQRPITSARVISLNSSPYRILENQQLSVTVQGETTIHTFPSTAFRVQNSGTAFEVVTSINGNPNLNFLASTTSNGTSVVIYPRDKSKNDIKVNRLESNDANDALGFQTATQYSLLLYKNGRPLFQDGLTAVVTTRLKSAWSTSITEGDTLQYSVDGTPSITATFTKEIFQQFDPTKTATVSAFTDINIWADVFNALMPGVVSTISGETIAMTSARGLSNDASIDIQGGTLKDKIFETGVAIVAEGRQSDYTLNKQTGQIGLTEALAPDDKVTAGSSFTRANLNTNQLPDGPPSAGNLWMVVDGAAKILSSGLEGNTLTTFSKTGSKITITATTPSLEPVAFDGISPGDWLVAWPEQTDASNFPSLYAYQGFWRVETVKRGEIVVDDGNTVRPIGGPETLPTDRLVFVQSQAPIQKLSYSLGTLPDFVNEIEANLEGVTAEIIGSTVRISTLTADLTGEIAIVAADSEGKALGIEVGDIQQNISSQRAFIVTEDTEAGMPSFSFTELGPYISDTEFTTPLYESIGGTKDDFIQILDRYEVTTEQLINLPDPNKDRRYFVENFDAATDLLTVDTREFSKDDSSVLKQGDRFFLRTSYQFDSTDTATAIVDGDAVTKIFGLPVARRITVNSNSTPTLDDFSADDAQSSLDLNDTASFIGFDFNDWKVWRQSSTILTDGSTYGLRVKAADFGPAGDTVRVGFVYPINTNQTSLDLVINNTSMIDIGIVIPVTQASVPNWDGTTSFTTDVTPLASNKDEVTYTWRVGTEPNFLAAFGGSSVDVGDLVIIDSSADFLSENKNIQAKVTNVTSNTFSIEIPGGVATSDNPTISTASNENRVYTVTTPTPHNIIQGDRIGLWDTEPVVGTISPIDGAYFPTVISPTSFSVQLSAAVPGGTISNAVHAGDLVTCQTIDPHNLNTGNVINISGFGVGDYDGTAVVLNVISPTTFSYIRKGSSSAAINGRFDFQSTSVDFSTVSNLIFKSGSEVTVQFPAAHSIPAGAVIDVVGTQLDSWNSSNTYNAGDLVFYAGQNYIALDSVSEYTPASAYSAGDFVMFFGTLYQALVPISSGPGNSPTDIPASWNTIANPGTPDLAPSLWSVTTISLDGRYIVDTVSSGSLTFTHYHTTGSANSSVGGSIITRKSYALIARSLGKSSAALSFAKVGTTSQEVIDYLSQEKSDILSAVLESPYTGGEAINTATKDNDIATGFLSGNALQIKTFKSSRVIELTVDAFVKEGSTITLDAPTAPSYSDTYSVFSQRNEGGNWILTLQSKVFADDFTTIALAGDTYEGFTDYIALRDGENSIATTDLDALIGDPQFSTKEAWSLIPTIGEELRLVATNTDQLTRFWNRLVVSGLSNVAEIENSEYGRQLQITTNTFGSEGSMQLTGGTANNYNVAIVGSGSELNNKVGVFTIPYELRRGITRKSWVKLEQTVRLNKEINLDGTSSIRVYADGIEILSGAGSFQTLRPTTQAADTAFRVEKHGDFTAFINISGTDLGLDFAGVEEGDWVRLVNNAASIYDSLIDYTPGQRVSFSGLNWTAIRASGPGSTIVSPIPTETWDIDAEYNQGDSVAYNGKAYLYSGVPTISGEYPDDPTSSWELIWETQEWEGGNTGIFKVVRTFGSNAFWIENDATVEGMSILGDPNNISFYSHDSVMPGDTLVISGNVLGAVNAGRYVVRDEFFGSGYLFPTATRIFTDPLVAGAPAGTILGDKFTQVNIEEAEPVRLWKRILAIGPGETGLANVIVDTPNLVNKISSSNAAFIEIQGKLGYDTVPAFGIDAYKHFGGLIKELNRVIYGDPTSPVEYPGVRAAGTSIGIREAIIKRIEIALSVRVRTGISFSDIRESIKAAVAGYVNNLGTGEQVALSKVVEAASKVNGVSSVVITFPDYDVATDQIAVGAQEKASIVNPTLDVTISIIDT